MRTIWIAVGLLVVAGGLLLIALGTLKRGREEGAPNLASSNAEIPEPILRGREANANEWASEGFPSGADEGPAGAGARGREFTGSITVLGDEGEQVRVAVYDAAGGLRGSATGRTNTEIPVASLPWSVLRVEAVGADARRGWAWLRPGSPGQVVLADAATIRGTVRAGDDQALRDAVVLAHYVTDDGMFTSRTALGRTDALGAFEIRHPGPGCRLFVLHPVWGGAFLEIPPDLTEPIGIALGAGSTRRRSFIVRDESSRPVAAALEWVLAGVVLWKAQETVDAFSVQWPPHETLRARVSAGGFVPRYLDTVTPGPEEPEVVVLEKGTGHLVRVLDGRGRPVSGAAVNVLGPLPERPGHLHRIRALSTDEDGTIRVSVPAGTDHVFTVVSPGSRVMLAALDRPEVTVSLTASVDLTVRLPAPAARDCELYLRAFDDRGRMYWGSLDTIAAGTSEVVMRGVPAGRKILEVEIPGQRAQERELYDESLVELRQDAKTTSVHIALEGALADDALPYRVVHIDTETEIAAGRTRDRAIRLQISRAGAYRIDLAPPLAGEGPTFEATPGEDVDLTWNTDECSSVFRWTRTVTDSETGARVADGRIRYASGDWSGQTNLSGGEVSLLLPANEDVRIRLSAAGHFDWDSGPLPGWELQSVDPIVLQRKRRVPLAWDASLADRLDVYCLHSMAGGGISHVSARPGDTMDVPLRDGLVWAVGSALVAEARWIHPEEDELELALVAGADLVLKTGTQIQGLVIEYPSLRIGVSPPGDWVRRPVREVQDLVRVPGRLARTPAGDWIVPPLLGGMVEVHVYRPGIEPPEIHRLELVAGKRTLLTLDVEGE